MVFWRALHLETARGPGSGAPPVVTRGTLMTRTRRLALGAAYIALTTSANADIRIVAARITEGDLIVMGSWTSPIPR